MTGVPPGWRGWRRRARRRSRARPPPRPPRDRSPPPRARELSLKSMVSPGGGGPPTTAYHRRMRDLLTRGRLAQHPLWARALSATELHARAILPVVVSGAVEDRERVAEAPWLERLSITELVREARA